MKVWVIVHHCGACGECGGMIAAFDSEEKSEAKMRELESLPKHEYGCGKGDFFEVEMEVD